MSARSLGELIALDGESALLSAVTAARGGGPSLKTVATPEVDGNPVAVLPMRLNVMGSAGLVMLTSDNPEPLIVSPQPNIIYNVTTLTDSQTGGCSAPSGSPLTSNCTTLRAAIIASNATSGPNEVVFGLNGAITLSVVGQDDNAQAGDLDVTSPLTILGNGAANTIIQGGPSAGNGVDKVFSFNPLGLQPGFAVSLSGLTIQFGANAVTDPTTGDNEGGAFDFDASTVDGAGSLSVANCNIPQNQTLNGDGGAIALFDGGAVTITNTVISGNVAGLQDPTSWFGYFGGGIYVTSGGYGFASSISITGGSVSNNTASTPGQTPGAQIGGGIYSDTPGVALQGTTVSGNTASSDGGGLYGDGFIVAGGSVISGNVSGGIGGGMFGLSSVVNSTLTNNSAAYWGGAFWSDGPGASIASSRIVGNAAGQSSSIVDADPIYGGTVTAANNWWGSNSSPANLFNGGVVTFSPWLVMTFSAPASLNTGAAGTLTASIDTGSDGSTGFAAPDGTPVTFSAALGTVTPANATTLSGSASSTYTAGPNAGTDSVTAAVDSQVLTATVLSAASAPTLRSVSPASGMQGASVAVTLTGTNFVSGATVSVDNIGVTVSSVTLVSPTQITAVFSIAAAALGIADVTVVTSAGASGVQNFGINPAPQQFVLDLAVTPANGGSISGIVGGLPNSCSTTCSSIGAAGATATLTATPAEGYTFASWTACPAPSGASCTVTLEGTVNVSATFTGSTPFTYTLGAIVQNRKTGYIQQTVTVTNSGPAVSACAVVADDLAAGVTMANASGITDSSAPPAGSPYLELGPIPANSSAAGTIQFTRTGTQAITYMVRILGPGPR
jgi:hypothetical protein